MSLEGAVCQSRQYSNLVR